MTSEKHASAAAYEAFLACRRASRNSSAVGTPKPPPDQCPNSTGAGTTSLYTGLAIGQATAPIVAERMGVPAPFIWVRDALRAVPRRGFIPAVFKSGTFLGMFKGASVNMVVAQVVNQGLFGFALGMCDLEVIDKNAPPLGSRR